MRNERLKTIATEIETMQQRLIALQAETIVELKAELATISAATYNARQAEEALGSIAALMDTAK